MPTLLTSQRRSFSVRVRTSSWLSWPSVKFASACHSLPVPLDPIAAIVAVQRTHRQRDPRRMSLQSAPQPGRRVVDRLQGRLAVESRQTAVQESPRRGVGRRRCAGRCRCRRPGGRGELHEVGRGELHDNPSDVLLAERDQGVEGVRLVLRGDDVAGARSLGAAELREDKRAVTAVGRDRSRLLGELPDRRCRVGQRRAGTERRRGTAQYVRANSARWLERAGLKQHCVR